MAWTQCLVCDRDLEDAGECLAFRGLIVYKEGHAVTASSDDAIAVHRACLAQLLDGYFIDLSFYRKTHPDS